METKWGHVVINTEKESGAAVFEIIGFTMCMLHASGPC
jgi:hypothetical protein